VSPTMCMADFPSCDPLLALASAPSPTISSRALAHKQVPSSRSTPKPISPFRPRFPSLLSTLPSVPNRSTTQTLPTHSRAQERLPDGPVQRAALFGRGGPPPGAASGYGVGSATAGGAESGARHALEEDNNRLAAELEAKVAALKQATIVIHDEVSEHNRMLNGMVSRVDSSASRRKLWC
jgi:hypothetical protein